MIALFIGAPASGKDTQAYLLQKYHQFTPVSGGEALREEVEKGGAQAPLIQAYMDRGELVPDEITNEAVANYIRQLGVSDRLALTGGVRRMHQVPAFDALMTKIGQSLTAAIYLKIDDATVYDRVAGRLYAPGSNQTYHVKYKPPKVPGFCDISGEPLVKRADDNEAAVAERLRSFHTETQVVIDYYREQGLLHEIDASQDIQVVYQEIERVLELPHIAS